MPTNKTVINIIIATLAGCAALCVFSVCLLSYQGIQIPPELNTLTGGLVGALTAMLVKTSPSETTKTVDVETKPVVVDAEPTEPKK